MFRFSIVTPEVKITADLSCFWASSCQDRRAGRGTWSSLLTTKPSLSLLESVIAEHFWVAMPALPTSARWPSELRILQSTHSSEAPGSLKAEGPKAQTAVTFSLLLKPASLGCHGKEPCPVAWDSVDLLRLSEVRLALINFSQTQKYLGRNSFNLWSRIIKIIRGSSS